MSPFFFCGTCFIYFSSSTFTQFFFPHWFSYIQCVLQVLNSWYLLSLLYIKKISAHFLIVCSSSSVTSYLWHHCSAFTVIKKISHENKNSPVLSFEGHFLFPYFLCYSYVLSDLTHYCYTIWLNFCTGLIFGIPSV